MTVLEAHVRLPSWRRHAACRGRGDLFFAADEVSQRIALAVCAGCGVREACLADVWASEPPDGRFGVVAGLTAAQRRTWRAPR